MQNGKPPVYNLFEHIQKMYSQMYKSTLETNKYSRDRPQISIIRGLAAGPGAVIAAVKEAGKPFIENIRNTNLASHLKPIALSFKPRATYETSVNNGNANDQKPNPYKKYGTLYDPKYKSPVDYLLQKAKSIYQEMINKIESIGELRYIPRVKNEPARQPYDPHRIELSQSSTVVTFQNYRDSKPQLYQKKPIVNSVKPTSIDELVEAA